MATQDPSHAKMNPAFAKTALAGHWEADCIKAKSFGEGDIKFQIWCDPTSGNVHMDVADKGKAYQRRSYVIDKDGEVLERSAVSMSASASSWGPMDALDLCDLDPEPSDAQIMSDLRQQLEVRRKT